MSEKDTPCHSVLVSVSQGTMLAMITQEAGEILCILPHGAALPIISSENLSREMNLMCLLPATYHLSET